MSSDIIERVNRRALLTIAGSGGIAGLSGCVGFGGGEESSDGGSDGDGPDTIVFGQPGALSGSFDFLQPGVSQAADAAVRHINEAGGPLGAELELVRRDTAVDPQEARTVTTQLVENDNAAAIVGLFSSEINPLWDFL
jgi:branched-chain amino acid transport system substrate-binding protein